MRTCGQHPGRMSGVGGGGGIFMSSLFYMFHNILNTFVYFFLWGKIDYFPPSLAENSAKIIIFLTLPHSNVVMEKIGYVGTGGCIILMM